MFDVRQQPPDDEQADDADREVDIEDPVPADVVSQEATEPRADDERDAEDSAEEALVLAAFGGCEQVADHGERDREQRSGAKSLEAPEQDQLGHVLREAGEGRTDEERGNAE